MSGERFRITSQLKQPYWTRVCQEKWEMDNLCESAARSALTRGRLKEEPPDPRRTSFRHDVTRIRYCLGYRLLSQKTQVYPDPISPKVQRRGFHVEEVQQVATDIADALFLNTDLTEAIGLGHDLGHTPFGHSGESVLDEISKEKQNGSRFRHNIQSLRVVDILEPHLNLTYEVREGIVCHLGETKETSIIPYGKSKEKERALSLENLKSTKEKWLGGRKWMPSTLEGCVVRITDRITAMPLDFEDAVQAGFLKQSDLPENVQKYLGKTTSEITRTLVNNIIESSWDPRRKNVFRIVLDPIIGQALNDLSDFNFERIYLNRDAITNLWQYAAISLRTIFNYYTLFADNPKKRKMTTQEAIDAISWMTDRQAIEETERINAMTIKPLV